MIKNFAIVSFTFLMLILFRGYIKEAVFDLRMTVMMSRIEVEEAEAEDQLREGLSRIGNGHRMGIFSQTERVTLEEMLREIRSYQGKEMPATVAEGFGSRLEIIADRHDL